MRITKTRLMRGPTINPNPPICKSKEPSYTLINIYSCADDHKITTIEHYNWNWTQAHEAANGGNGTYTEGYFYEAAFKKTTSLDQKHCGANVYVQITYDYSRPWLTYYLIEMFGQHPGADTYGHTEFDGTAVPFEMIPPDERTITFDQYIPSTPPIVTADFYTTVDNMGPRAQQAIIDPTEFAGPMPKPTGDTVQTFPDLP